MRVDARTGEVALPNGFSFSANLTQSQFEAVKLHDPAQVYHHHTPWMYFPFIAGQLEGKPLKVSPCFYREVLTHMEFQVMLHPERASSWDDFSYMVEEQMQTIHARLLQQWFGPPHQKVRDGMVDEAFPALADSLIYTFRWGSVWCGFDQRSSSAAAGVRYTKQDTWARKDYERRAQRS
jgi:hypothetical protein